MNLPDWLLWCGVAGVFAGRALLHLACRPWLPPAVPRVARWVCGTCGWLPRRWSPARVRSLRCPLCGARRWVRLSGAAPAPGFAPWGL